MQLSPSRIGMGIFLSRCQRQIVSRLTLQRRASSLSVRKLVVVLLCWALVTSSTPTMLNLLHVLASSIPYDKGVFGDYTDGYFKFMNLSVGNICNDFSVKPISILVVITGFWQNKGEYVLEVTDSPLTVIIKQFQKVHPQL